MKMYRGIKVLKKPTNLDYGMIAAFLTVSVLIVWGLTLSFVNANTDSDVILELDRTEVEVGEVVRATVRINNVENFAGYQLNIGYDPDVVEVVNPDTGEDSPSVVIGDLVNESEYGILPVISNDSEKGLLTVARTYMDLDDFKESGQVQETGILFEVGFKVIKEEMTSIKFKANGLNNHISGTALFDLNGDRISNYTVTMPEPLNSSMAPTPEPTLEPTPEPDEASVFLERELVPKLDNYTGEAKSAIESNELLTAISEAKAVGGIRSVLLNIKEVEGAYTYVQELPTDVLSYSNLVHKILISTEFGTIEIPSNFLSQKGVPTEITNSSTVSFSIKASDAEGVDENSKSKIGERPVIELDVLIGGEVIDWDNLFVPFKVSIPYSPSIQEFENYEHIVVRHIEEVTNKAIPVTSGKYDVSFTRKVEFVTNNFGKFAVAYDHKTFNDIDSYSWAKKQIEVLASKGVISGTSKTTFTPGNDITRADFMILLIKALDLYSEFESNFSDVSSESYYYEYVGMAKELGITSGVGNNMFNPLEKITRQDMMVLTTNALKIAGKVSTTGNNSDIDQFNDKNQIASYAVEGVATLVKEGIVVGSGNNINPFGNATRAELAAMIYKIYYM
ncbi:S-layer homology domain-containing protein [Herbivorax sp. ANBcel31]|uniref:S-layer homology domain-containing protein n=1 Tax=Herbivorax sp. ANBcel31 TaxID=3069754 RepID=UPI0027B65042|nr:S-layer homology domain-containing protein [Herbivorax sp. ANBcel31]MDQ2085000.1 S-layer homology domain-containing protein [Herbivorax sp. ANBcel31]